MREDGYSSVQIQKSALAAVGIHRSSALGKCIGDSAPFQLVQYPTFRLLRSFLTA